MTTNQGVGSSNLSWVTSLKASTDHGAGFLLTLFLSVRAFRLSWFLLEKRALFLSAKVGADGKIDASRIKTAVQQDNKAVSSMARLSLMTWRQENNDMNKRLGEVRASEGSQGIWARMARGQSK